MKSPAEIRWMITEKEIILKHSALSGDQRQRLEIEIETLRGVLNGGNTIETKS